MGRQAVVGNGHLPERAVQTGFGAVSVRVPKGRDHSDGGRFNRGVFTSVTELKREIERFIKIHNKELAKPFRWTKDAATIIGAVERAKKALPN